MAYWRHMATQIWVNIGSGNGLLPVAPFTNMDLPESQHAKVIASIMNCGIKLFILS